MSTVIVVCIGIYFLLPQDSLFDCSLVIVLTTLTVIGVALGYMDKAKRNSLMSSVLNRIKG